MWQQFIHTWNGAKCFLFTSWMDSDSLTLHTDDSGTLGNGGILGNKWFQGQWETHQQRSAAGISIAWQELFALVVACTCGRTSSLISVLFSIVTMRLLLA